jgi:hypothetical protein
MADEQTPFHDVVRLADGFSIPELKFRELVFVGALRPEGELFVRDSSRPLPNFRDPDLFPDGVRLRARRSAGRVELRPERTS